MSTLEVTMSWDGRLLLEDHALAKTLERLQCGEDTCIQVTYVPVLRSADTAALTLTGLSNAPFLPTARTFKMEQCTPGTGGRLVVRYRARN